VDAVTSAVTPAGWYADPSGAPCWRYWDGAAWTDRTQGWFRPARDAIGTTLVLDRGGVGNKPEDLKLGSESVVRLAWGGMLNRLTGDLEVQSADGRWRLDQQGLLHPKVVITSAAGQVGLYDWRAARGDGTLSFADGRRLEWAAERAEIGNPYRSNDQSGQWWMWDAQRRAVLGGALAAQQITVTLRPEAAEIPELGLVTGLAAFLVVRWWDSQAKRDRRNDLFD
jgi:hypothetical protein